MLEAWTGIQVAWTMARGYAGAFGRTRQRALVWIPLCLAFLLPFLRRPWRLLHLDLAVLLAFSISLAFFSAARIDVSVPLAYPPLVYLLVRMLLLARAAERRRRPPGRRCGSRCRWATSCSAIVFLLGFRIGLNVSART